ncbi:hypothetical protein BD770DRAFT_416862 [Pilaira anomala]|nr:hypothetical protein BD770DRAFT_416862 [Pilaira anomala]
MVANEHGFIWVVNVAETSANYINSRLLDNITNITDIQRQSVETANGQRSEIKAKAQFQIQMNDYLDEIEASWLAQVQHSNRYTLVKHIRQRDEGFLEILEMVRTGFFNERVSAFIPDSLYSR